jgi:hypothetical protein
MAVATSSLNGATSLHGVKSKPSTTTAATDGVNWANAGEMGGNAGLGEADEREAAKTWLEMETLPPPPTQGPAPRDEVIGCFFAPTTVEGDWGRHVAGDAAERLPVRLDSAGD